MSSLSRKNWRQLGARVLAGLATTLAGHALAADRYFVPQVELDFIHHTNPELISNSSSASGYLADASAILGLQSPRSKSELRPRIQYENYSSRSELRHVNQYIDLNSYYNLQRSQWTLVGSYSRENSFAAQSTPAAYDSFDPNDPTIDSTGRIAVISQTYSRVQVRPGFSHSWNERFGTEVNALYQQLRFDTAIASTDAVNYNYLQGDAGMFWNLRPLTRVSAGLYAAKYESVNQPDTTTARGASVEFGHNWSRTFSGTFTTNVERTKQDNAGLAQDDESTNWGADVAVMRKGQIDALRLNAGRTFSPSGAGARVTVDQVRVQYSRNFKPLWSYQVAVRAFRTRESGTASAGNDRDYMTGSVQLNRELTRTVYLTGNYSISRQKYVTSDSTQDRVLTLGIGYRGLDPQR